MCQEVGKCDLQSGKKSINRNRPRYDSNDRLADKDLKQLLSYNEFFKGKHECNEERTGKYKKRQN